MPSKETLIAVEPIQNKIYLIRRQKVMLDRDLAELYGVLTKNLNKAVKRNLERFPEDFAFILTKEEDQNLKFQIGTSSWGGERYLPFVFTEHGILMLSSVLRSKRAVQVNIQIMRTFTKLRELMISHKDLALKLSQLEKKVGQHDKEIQIIFESMRRLMDVPVKNDKYKRTKIGYIVEQ